MRPLFCGCVLWLSAFAALGDFISIAPDGDATIFDGTSARDPNGLPLSAATTMIVGQIHIGDTCRGLLRFNLSSVPTNAAIISATVTINVVKAFSVATDTLAVYRITNPWTESGATWNSSGLAAWSGGTFLPEADATRLIDDLGSFTFESTPQMIGTVQMWLTNSSSNNGWILVNTDGVTNNARRISTREASGTAPTLRIEYSMPPPPPADFNVTSPGFFFSINGQEPNPELTLTRGSNYTFAVSTDPSHPLQIVRDTGGTAYEDGIVNNNISSGTLTFTVPPNAPDTLFYICPNHFFSGTIRIVNPAEPVVPLVQILSMELSASNVVLKSTGTNGWLAIPEFSSNLLVSNWAVVPDFTNSFANGTNVTTFNRLEPFCGSNVFLRMKITRN